MSFRDAVPKVAHTVIGAWNPAENASRGKTGVFIVYATAFGTAHAGDLRKHWRVPEAVISKAPLVQKICESNFEQPKPHHLLVCDDKELAEAFERLVAEPSFAKIGLNDWEFKLAADAPSVFIEWGGFTWKQRKYLRQIVRKILEQ